MVKNVFKQGIYVFTLKQTNILSAAFFIILTTVLSQILGFLKYRLLVSIFGASSDLGIFFAAFKIPDFLFQVLIAAALSSCFIPIFSNYLVKDEKEHAYQFTSSLLTIGFASFVLLSIVIFILAYPLATLVAPGISPRELTTMVHLMRIIQLSQLFFILGTLITAVLQSFQHFLVPGIASSLYNVGIIIGTIILVPVLGIYGAGIGVLLGAVLFCLVQLPFLKMTGFTYIPSFNLHNEGVVRTIKLMIPRSLTLLVSQIATVATLFFASFISLRSYGIFELAYTLVMAPVVLFGQSIAQASFPTLAVKQENPKEFASIFLSSFSQILYLTLPISVILIVLRIPMVRLFYGAKLFDWQATIDTGRTLSFLSLSLTAQAITYLLSRAFYAHKDTKTPFFITCGSVIFYISVSYLFILVDKQPIYYLALALSAANVVSSLLLIIFINRKVPLPKLTLLFTSLKIIIAGFAMGVALYIPIKLLDQLVIDTTRTIGLIMLTGIASSLGFLSYVFFTWLLDIREAYYIIRVFKRFSSGKSILKQIEELIDGSKLNP